MCLRGQDSGFRSQCKATRSQHREHRTRFGSFPESRLLNPDPFLFIRVWLGPERFAAEVERRADLDFAIAFDLALARQPHLVLVADYRERRLRVKREIELLP